MSPPGVHVLWSVACGLNRWCQYCNSFDTARALVASGAVPVASLISHRFELHQANDAFRQLAAGEAGKVLIMPNGKMGTGPNVSLSRASTAYAGHRCGCERRAVQRFDSGVVDAAARVDHGAVPSTVHHYAKPVAACQARIAASAHARPFSAWPRSQSSASVARSKL